ncbi:hypothetical protein EJ07DRAFT_78694, partial [Lizonia empirigonia]
PTRSSAPSTPPPLTWLTTSWNVTHSTLPMWKKFRNVRITYTALSTPNGGATHLDDTVTYQPLSRSKSKISTVRGVDKPDDSTSSTSSTQPPHDFLASACYTWRGRGWLMIATSRWEILGWGDEPATGNTDTGNSWVVTYFAKTLFTPAGVDVYSRRGVLRPETVAGIQRALEELGGEVAGLAGGMFEVAYDGEREG